MKKHNVAAAILFCGFLIAIAAGYLLLPKYEFSEMERRYLAETPDFRWETVFSGEWSRQAEDYLSDHVPGRNLFVGINSYMELLAGRQKLKDVWLVDGRILEAPAEADSAAVDKKLKTISAFAGTIGKNVDLMVVPSAGWAAGVAGYTDDAIIAEIYGKATDGITPVDVTAVFAGKPELYYATDHHWVSRGAHAGYQAYMTYLGRDFRPAEAFTVETITGFQGSTYARSALWLTPAETLELWHGSEGITVTNRESEEIHDGVFYRERLEEADKYTVFLDGNHSLVRIQNPNAEGKILVIRDSYSNSLGCFLAESYGEVVLVDLRYYRESISQLVAEEGFDDVLVCYSIGNFLTDTNIAWLR